MLRLLAAHPRLKIIFAHFFFMSAQLRRLDKILSLYPNLMVDLTPGIEMYESFSARPQETADFFRKYHDRICYGTDIGGRCILTNEGQAFNEKECLRRPEIVRTFLTGKEECVIESDGAFLIGRKPFVMKPLGLEGKQLEEIFSGNILRMLKRQ